MLALRAVLGMAFVFQGGLCLSQSVSGLQNLCGLAGLLLGGLVTIGFLTPIAVLFVGLEAAAVAISLLPICCTDLFGSKLLIAFTGAIWLAVLLLGPGAFSVDARLFGRREIIIPSKPSLHSDL